jgi:hypothetical protein
MFMISNVRYATLHVFICPLSRKEAENSVDILAEVCYTFLLYKYVTSSVLVISVCDIFLLFYFQVSIAIQSLRYSAVQSNQKKINESK